MSVDQSPIIPKTLGIHVLSGQSGESVVVSLPDGHWFVVDAFTGESAGAHNGTHAVLSFIDRFGLAHDRCLFVLLTHLHQDHYSGIPGLVQRLRKTNPDLPFAASYVYQRSAIDKVVNRIVKAHKKIGNSVTGIGRRSDELYELFKNPYEAVFQWKPLDGGGQCEGLQFGAVWPSELFVGEYYVRKAIDSQLSQLEKTEREKIKKDAKASLALSTLNKNINNLSVVLCIKFGSNRVLLGADAENESWEALGKAPCGKAGLSLLGNVLNEVCLLKAPHHGSRKTWTPVLTEVYQKTQYAMVTHNKGSNYHLPDLEGIRQILNTKTTLVVPNKRWLPVSVPEEWQVDQPYVHRIPVYMGNRGGKAGAKKLNKQYRNCRQSDEIRDEVAWASISLEDSGQWGPWYGGSGLVFLKAKEAISDL